MTQRNVKFPDLSMLERRAPLQMARLALPPTRASSLPPEVSIPDAHSSEEFSSFALPLGIASDQEHR